jgi:peptidoglycan/xylan/chitin deacetylase (PgdA/CDA1 family)
MIFSASERDTGNMARLRQTGVRQTAKRAALSAMRKSGIFYLSALKRRRSIPILCYHGIWMVDDGFPGDAMFMRASSFRRRMQLIRELGLEVISLDRAVDAIAGHGDVPPNAVVITIDDGWYSTYRHMLPELTAHGMTATLYTDTAQLNRGGVVAHVMARYVRKVAEMRAPVPAEAEAAYAEAVTVENPPEIKGNALERFADQIGFDLRPYYEARAFEYMTPEELQAFAAAGCDIQLHTHNHTMGDLSPGAVGAEIDANAVALSMLLGRPSGEFRHFCYPSGVKDDRIADWLLSRGIRSATTTVRGMVMPGAHMGLLPRLIDGDNVSEIEFEAEVRGVADKLRWPFSL